MESKGNATLLTATKVTEFTLNQGGYIPLAFGGLLLLGCFSAYVIAVSRGNVDPILPLISDAAGSPPQNGIFGTLICVGGMLGVIFMVQRYMIVLEKNRDKSKLVATINRLSLFVGVVSMLGITLITGYPVNFYRNRDVWLMDVGLPHMIGGVMLFSLGLVYISLQCVLTLFLKSKNEWALPIRVLLLLCCTATFVYHMITVPDNFGGISHLYYMNDTEIAGNDTSLLPYPPTLGADLKLPIDTGGTYFISAVTEWAFVIFFCCFFFTFFSELQQYSLLVVIETHTPQEKEIQEETKVDFKKASLVQRNGNQIDVKPAPEVKKFLRRDSTCQTMDDVIGRVIEPRTNRTFKTANKTTTNGIKNVVLDKEVDAKLNRLLNEMEKKDAKVSENGTQHSVSTDCDDIQTDKLKKETDTEAERIAIGKIDDVVKNAEKDVNLGKETAKTQTKKIDEDEEKPSSCPLAVQ